MVVEHESDVADRTVLERDPRIGRVLCGRYRLDEHIAEGGFGSVYRATHLPSSSAVAIKLLRPENGRELDLVARFRREGAVLASLHDPHTITAYEIGEAEGMPFIAMELLTGESLYDRFVARGPLPWQDVARIAREVCSSLAEAHALGIVHRDLKPSNIHLEPRGDATEFVKVIDFGIAKMREAAVKADVELTRQGQMIGTFDYMSPEQMIGSNCTPASDIYTLGVVMYEMIAGVRPFPGDLGPATMLTQLLTESPPPLSRHRAVPAELEAIVMRCLEREPMQRFGDIGEVADALDALEPDPLDIQITGRMPIALPQPALPLPRPPSSGFEARGSEPGIYRSDLAQAARHQQLVHRAAWVFLALVVALVALAVALS